MRVSAPLTRGAMRLNSIAIGCAVNWPISEAKIAAQNATIEALQAAAAAHATASAQQAKDLKRAEQARGEWAATAQSGRSRSGSS